MQARGREPEAELEAEAETGSWLAARFARPTTWPVGLLRGQAQTASSSGRYSRHLASRARATIATTATMATWRRTRIIIVVVVVGGGDCMWPGKRKRIVATCRLVGPARRDLASKVFQLARATRTRPKRDPNATRTLSTLSAGGRAIGPGGQDNCAAAETSKQSCAISRIEPKRA